MKLIKRLSAVIATLLLGAAVFAFAGCSASYPEITIHVTYGTETYDLRFTLNKKNYYEETVNHFLSVVDDGFYNDTVIHNIDSSSSRMFGGHYTWKNNALSENGKDETAYNGVRGEFESNGFIVENNPLKNELGGLAMYYYTTGSKEDGDYKTAGYDGARTGFYILTGSNTSLDGNYCVFGMADAATKEFITTLAAAETTETDGVDLRYLIGNPDDENKEIVDTTQTYNVPRNMRITSITVNKR